MALSANTVLEVRTTGNDLNAGGFVSGTSGTDYSQQDTPQYSFTDLVIDAVTNTKVTSASHSFAAADVGNLINIPSGTGFTTGRYQVVSVASGAATLDRAVGTVSSTGGTWRLGGALASWGIAAATANVAGIKVWVKGGTYNLTSNTYNASGGPAQLQARNRWEGYQTTRGDLGTQPLLFNTGGPINRNLFDDSANQSSEIVNLKIDNNNVTGNYGFYCGPFGYNRRCIALNCPGAGFYVNQETVVVGGLATGCQYGFWCFATARFVGCEAKSNTNCGFNFNQGVQATFCLSYSNTNDGFLFDTRAELLQCTSAKNGRHGYNQSSGQLYMANCIAEQNTQWGLFSAGGFMWLTDFATYNNGSGAISPSNPPQRNDSPITGTASFFTNSTTFDFSLNNTAGGGALLRSAGVPQTFPLGTTINKLDIGASQLGGGGGGGGSSGGGAWPFVG